MWLGSQEWSVNPVPFGHEHLDDAYGITYYEPHLEIFYACDRPAREVFDTIWHELTHALNHAFDLRAKSASLARNDEAVAQCHGHAWTQVMLDNPAFVEWLDLATNFIKSEQESLTE